MTDLLPRSKNNMLKPGMRVQLKNGEIVTVKGLEFNVITTLEKGRYVPKRDIHTIVDDER